MRWSRRREKDSIPSRGRCTVRLWFSMTEPAKSTQAPATPHSETSKFGPVTSGKEDPAGAVQGTGCRARDIIPTARYRFCDSEPCLTIYHIHVSFFDVKILGLSIGRKARWWQISFSFAPAASRGFDRVSVPVPYPASSKPFPPCPPFQPSVFQGQGRGSGGPAGRCAWRTGERPFRPQ